MIRKLSLYWKTWIITVLTILLTLGVFYLIFSQFAPYFLGNSQKNRFKQVVYEIKKHTEKNGVDEQFLANYYRSGFNVAVFEKDQLVFPILGVSSELIYLYPELTNESSQQIIEGNTAEISETNNILINTEATTETSVLITNEQVSYKGKNYQLSVSYPLSLNKEDIQQVFTSIAPYFIMIGVVISFIVSIVYAKYFSSKITKLNTAIHQMGEGVLVEGYQPKDGDELQELENNLHQMYQDLQDALKQLNQEVQLVKRMEKDRQLFMRGATHELKTPMMAMSTMLEGMLENVAGYEDRQLYLKACYGRLQSMGKLVNEMLEVSRIEGIVYQGRMNLADATNEIVDIYDYMLKDKEIRLDCMVLPDTEIAIPKRNLQKVLSNLVGNAVKYTPENGEISIVSTKESWIISNTMEKDSIKDKTKIFEPFISYETISENEFEKSHGLGLYIVDAILSHYGVEYTYQIDNQQNQFVVRLILTD